MSSNLTLIVFSLNISLRLLQSLQPACAGVGLALFYFDLDVWGQYMSEVESSNHLQIGMVDTEGDSFTWKIIKQEVLIKYSIVRNK